MQLRRLIRLTLLLLTMLATSVVLAAPAQASTAVHITGGSTSLTVARGTLGVLTANHVTVTPIKGATASGRTFTFPIKDGKVDATTLAGDIDHNGGLQFAAGGKKLEVQDFVINAGTGTLTAKVRGTDTRIPLLKLNLGKAHITKGKTQVVVSNVGASLTGTAASALNKTFNVHLFTDGLNIGVARVTARI